MILVEHTGSELLIDFFQNLLMLKIQPFHFFKEAVDKVFQHLRT